MKYLLSILLISSIASASRLEPKYKCSNKEKSFSIMITNAAEGIVKYKHLECPFEIVDLSVDRNRVGANNINLNFEVRNCEEQTFYKKGFLKIEEDATNKGYINYVLALKGSQTFVCEASGADVKKLLKLAEKNAK